MTKQIPQKLRLACFVSSHGLGHASRVCAVLQQIAKELPTLEVWLAGDTPLWFWKMNLPQNCTFILYEEATDVGLVQAGPFKHELKLTLERVLGFIQFPADRIKNVIAEVKKFQPHFILSDISPLGIKIGQHLKMPTLLLENFTWDWIYQPFLEKEKRFEEIIFAMQQIYSLVDMRLQCTPFCQAIAGARVLNPVYRQSMGDKKHLFSQLGIDEDEQYILVTTGGISMHHSFGEISQDHYLVIPGDYPKKTSHGRTIYLPMNANISFPDLVQEASCVVGKAGYGTIAECWGMNTPFLGVFRNSFRESDVLRKFCQQNLVFQEISLQGFHDGSWVNSLPSLFAKASKMNSIDRVNGAKQASAEMIKFALSLI